jgi:hypothetical protein
VASLHPRSSACICGFLLLAGCATAVEKGETTALTGFDLVSMTDQMAAGIGSDPEVNAAVAGGPVSIVVMPVVNELTAEVIPRGQAVAFTGRVRVLLAKNTPGKYTWVMNRDAFYDLQKRERDLRIDAGPSPDRVNPQYALTARFSNIINEDQKRRDSFYLCVFELTSVVDGSILWSGSYEVKKQAVKGFLD